jgi:hypothetical protein
MIEWGALPGVISLGIILYDKLVSGRPMVYPTPTNNPVGGQSLMIFNPGDSDILIRSIRVSPDIYTVMKSDSVRDGLESASGKPWVVVLGPRSSAEIPLAAKAGSKEKCHQPVRISVSWYKPNSPWWPYKPVVLTTSTTRLRELMGVADSATSNGRLREAAYGTHDAPEGRQ